MLILILVLILVLVLLLILVLVLIRILILTHACIYTSMSFIRICLSAVSRVKSA